jgi:hypothetical protein
MPILTQEAELSRVAWSEYAERLQGLEGASYERAEAEAVGHAAGRAGRASEGSPLPSEPIE